jgi:thiol:disulfide interchange protein
VFAAIGLGMALPYIVLSAYPKLISRMPRTGPASELIKQVMGLLMLAAAVYFIGVGVSGILVEPPNPPTKAYWWAVAVPLVLAGLWLIYRTVKITSSIPRRLGFGLFGLLFVLVAIGGAYRFTDKGPIDWTYYTHERFDNALADGQVVVLEYTAEWCLNCKALEEKVLHSEAVAAAIAEADVHPIKVDLTKGYPDGNERLTASGRLTIPLLQIFSPDGKEAFKSDAYTQTQVLNAIAKARGGQ